MLLHRFCQSNKFWKKSLKKCWDIQVWVLWRSSRERPENVLEIFGINLPGTSLERQIKTSTGRNFRMPPGRQIRTSPGRYIDTSPGHYIDVSLVIYNKKCGEKSKKQYRYKYNIRNSRHKTISYINHSLVHFKEGMRNKKFMFRVKKNMFFF